MSQTTIEWTDTTRNPVAGCSANSAACTKYYVILMVRRLEAIGIEKYVGLILRPGRCKISQGHSVGCKQMTGIS